jgi:hypothetical protein
MSAALTIGFLKKYGPVMGKGTVKVHATRNTQDATRKTQHASTHR